MRTCKYHPDPKPDICKLCWNYLHHPLYGGDGVGYDGPPITPWRFIKTSDLIDTTVHTLLPRLPLISGVCGVVRSGMIPASALACHLHLPLWSVSQHEGEPQLLAQGTRGVYKTDGPLLIVDDTSYSGRAIASLRHRLKGDYLYASIYAKPESQRFVDYFAEELESPHLAEWNLVNNAIMNGHAYDARLRGGIALDFDGIICDNPHGAEVDPLWLVDAKPLLLPRRAPVKLVITARHEDYRQHTLDWSKKFGVRIERLEMWKDGDGDVAAWKARVYKDSGCSLYVESEPHLAEAIAKLSGRPVACPRAGKVYQSPTTSAPKVASKPKGGCGCGNKAKSQRLAKRLNS